MNMMKKNGGFTLVELIVVIAILAILAGVAVPAYSGYMDKAKEASVLSTCDAIKTAVFASYAEEGDAMPTSIGVSDGDVTVGGTTIADEYLANFTVYYGALTTFDIDGYTAAWSGSDWTITAP